MLVLTMTSSRLHVVPTVLFDQLDHFSNLHRLPKILRPDGLCDNSLPTQGFPSPNGLELSGEQRPEGPTRARCSDLLGGGQLFRAG